jgi:hypothetical protein
MTCYAKTNRSEKMKIRYAWSPRTADPAEVTTLELTTEHVPRIGELVEIEIQVTKEEWCVKSGRVKDVIWTVRREPMVSVLLGA